MISGTDGDDRESETTPVGTPPAGVTDVPATLGRYAPQQLLGKGGMGVVYRALDPDLLREVALKVVRREWLGKEGQARLLREAQAMAQTNHPNVVQILDVTTWQDRVVVAMELVDGVDVKQWLRDEPRPWARVVDVFLDAARGLAAVHDAGLTHRDFKPANVLLASDGRVMVTDFGLARDSGESSVDVDFVSAASGDADSRDSGLGSGSSSHRSKPSGSLQQITKSGEVMGTPAYMAPEQRYRNGAQPASDQYALCISLWEGLCGGRPPTHAPYERAPGGLVPPWPDPPGVPKDVGRVLRRGLAVDPTERFATMADLIDALERARAPRSRRWIAVVGVTLAGVAATAWVTAPGGERCPDAPLEGVWGRERRSAIDAAFAGDAGAASREIGTRVVAELDAYADTWIAQHAQTCPIGPDELAPAVRDQRMACLSAGRRALDTTVELLASGHSGTLRRGLDMTRRLPAVQPCGRLVASSKVPPPTHPTRAAAVAAVEQLLAKANALEGAGRYDEGFALVAPLAEQADTLGDPSLHARALFSRGALHGRRSHPKEAVEDLSAAVDVAEAARDDATASIAASRLAYTLGWDLGRGDEALVEARRALALGQRADPDGAQTAGAHATLGTILHTTGDLDGALEHAKLAFAYFDDRDDSWNRDNVRSEIAQIFAQRGQLDEASRLFEQTLQSREATLPAGHPEIANSVSNLGVVFAQAGDFVRAEPLMQRGYELRRDALGPDHMAVADSLGNLANVRGELGQFELALQGHRESLATYQRTLGPKHPRVANSQDSVAGMLHALGRFEEAVPLMREALDVFVELHGPDHPRVARMHSNLANSLGELGRWEESARHESSALRILEATEGPNGATLAYTLINAGQRANQRDDADTALTHLTRAIEILEAVEGEHPARLSEAYEALAYARSAHEDPAGALQAQRRALELQRQVYGDDDERTAASRSRVATLAESVPNEADGPP